MLEMSAMSRRLTNPVIKGNILGHFKKTMTNPVKIMFLGAKIQTNYDQNYKTSKIVSYVVFEVSIQYESWKQEICVGLEQPYHP